MEAEDERAHFDWSWRLYWSECSLLCQHLCSEKLGPCPALPWGTLVVNVTGSFVIGVFLVWTTERILTDPAYRLLVAVGFCGAYTTFSSYAFETVRLMEQGHFLSATGNFLANNLLAVLGVLAGITLARSI